jgi:hypothetical protein
MNTHNGYRPFENGAYRPSKCYDDDISYAMSTKTDNDLAGWLFNTRRMAASILVSSDNSKGDPVALSEKLANRADQMEEELKKREAYKTQQIEKKPRVAPMRNSVSAMPIGKPLKKDANTEWVKQAAQVKATQFPPRVWSQFSITSSEEERAQREADDLQCAETDALEGSPTLTQRIENEGKIFIE